MSILINGIEMPKDDEILCINIHPDGKVYINLDLDCKQIATATSVPPHGRLVEDTAVIDQIDDWLDSVGTVFLGHGMSYYGELIGCVEDAPTIIPAEESNRV